MKFFFIAFILQVYSFSVAASSISKGTQFSTIIYMLNGKKYEYNDAIGYQLKYGDEISITTNSKKINVKKRDIDKIIYTNKLNGKIIDRAYIIFLGNDKDEILPWFVILKTKNYTLAYRRYGNFAGHMLNENNEEQYIILDKDKRVITSINNDIEASNEIGQYFSKQKVFIQFLEVNNFKLKICDFNLIRLGAYLYANKYYKDKPLENALKVNSCIKKKIKDERSIDRTLESENVKSEKLFSFFSSVPNYDIYSTYGFYESNYHYVSYNNGGGYNLGPTGKHGHSSGMMPGVIFSINQPIISIRNNASFGLSSGIMMAFGEPGIHLAAPLMMQLKIGATSTVDNSNWFGMGLSYGYFFNAIGFDVSGFYKNQMISPELVFKGGRKSFKLFSYHNLSGTKYLLNTSKTEHNEMWLKNPLMLGVGVNFSF